MVYYTSHINGQYFIPYIRLTTMCPFFIAQLEKETSNKVLLLMEEILHHPGCKKPCKQWDIYLNWFSRWISGCHQQYYLDSM